MSIRKDIMNGIRSIRRESQKIEANKKTSVERHRAFLAERKENSPSQKRIDAMRAAIQNKPQSDR